MQSQQKIIKNELSITKIIIFLIIFVIEMPTER